MDLLTTESTVLADRCLSCLIENVELKSQPVLIKIYKDLVNNKVNLLIASNFINPVKSSYPLSRLKTK